VTAALRPPRPAHPRPASVATGGRPLDPELTRTILDAAVTVLAEVGYGQLTIEAVAQRAGVHRPAIYRRWPTKVDLVAAAVTSIAQPISDPDTGNTRDDLVEFLGRVATLLQRNAKARLGFLLMAELAFEPEVVAIINSRMRRPWRGRVDAIVARGMERGELREGVDPEQLSDLVLAALYARALSGRPQPNRREIVQLVDLLLDGVSGAPRRQRRTTRRD
jgi:AcrR family transcriptional regulator